MLNNDSTAHAIDISREKFSVGNESINKNSYNYLGKRMSLFIVVLLGIAIPIFGTIITNNLFSGWKHDSLFIHSTFEVAGAIFGLILAIIILYSKYKMMTTRRMWIACAFVAMAAFDIIHSCVPIGVSFVWLHSLAVLAGGVFFVMIWTPEREVSQRKAFGIAGFVMVGAILLGILSAYYPDQLPVMVLNGKFTAVAQIINFLGGGLALIAALNFSIRYYQNQDSEELLYLILTLLFGTAGVIFYWSGLWEAGWWFWHTLRFSGYFMAFWLALFYYRNSEEKLMSNLITQVNEIASGNFTLDISTQQNNIGLRMALKSMTQTLKNNQNKVQQQDWLKTGITRLNSTIQGELDIYELSKKIITEICSYLDIQLGAFYILKQKKNKKFNLMLTGSYAFQKRKNLSNKFELGEGLAGQAALEQQRIIIRNVPKDYTQISSTFVENIPKYVCIEPFLFKDEVKGVIEIGTVYEFKDMQLKYLSEAKETIAISVQTAQNRAELDAALKESQSLTQELQGQQNQLEEANEELKEQTSRLRNSEQQLQAQQEELRVTNEELTEQTKQLQKSEEDLKTQQEELQVTNEELEEKTRHLLEQKKEVEIKNAELKAIRFNLEEKAKELEITSKYKSEFLANMSHELRTPLNSILLLSQRLHQNRENTLSPNQIKAAKIINDSGNDLLQLINEVLDLAKIEAGKVDLNISKVDLRDTVGNIKELFKPQIKNKNLKFTFHIENGLPTTIYSDQQRLEQIVKNFMSNAIKFTDQGEIKIELHRPEKNVRFKSIDLPIDKIIGLSVIDSGIGIPENKRREIFEAFQQVDGSTSRKYGGTGLGLSISRELAKLLGGEIQLKSTDGEGSTFTFYCPENIEDAEQTSIETTPHQEFKVESQQEKTIQKNVQQADTAVQKNLQNISDDRDELKETDRTILVIEDDLNFARTLYDICHEKGFKCIHAADGEAGLKYAKEFHVDAIILDIKLPKLDGWGVLESLKENSATRHIPVHIMSVDDASIDAYKKGVIGYLTKPVLKENLDQAFDKIENWLSKDLKDLLIVEDDKNLCQSIMQLIGNGDVKITAVDSGKKAINKIKSGKFDCMILDLSLPDLSGFDILKKLDELKNVSTPPVIIYTGKDLTHEEEYELRKYADSIIIKGVKSDERLLDETALFLHRVVDNLPDKKKKMISKLYDKEQLFKGKKILVVDDDMRNVFAISQVLEEREMVVLRAADGQKALDILSKEKDIDLVLMDIMMPVMDGYQTIRSIRKEQRYWKLPILALTAKAMKQDREKCIEAGANDYLTKPVDIDRLLSMMRIWLYK